MDRIFRDDAIFVLQVMIGLPGLGIILLAVVGVIAAAADETERRFHLNYSIDDHTLSASVALVAATDVLIGIAEAASIRVRVRGDVGIVRAQSFEGLPLDVAIQRLFRSPERSLVMLYEVASDGGQRLAEVRLSPRAVAQAPQPPRPEPETPPLVAAASFPGLPPPPLYLRLPPPPPPPRRRPAQTDRQSSASVPWADGKRRYGSGRPLSCSVKRMRAEAAHKNYSGGYENEGNVYRSG
jgi:hypothetical protein